MEQPRFGGVAILPLSGTSGEGESQQSISKAREEERTRGLGQTSKDEHPAIKMASRDQTAGDCDVQRVMDVLDQLGISTEVERHKLKHERQREAGFKHTEDRLYCKNLLLKDKKGQAYLVVCDENDTADLQVLKYHFHTQGNLHFASPQSLYKLFRVNPGAISPLALLHSPRGSVRVFIDAELVNRIDKETTNLRFHPLRGDLEVGLTFTELERFLHYCRASLEILPSLTKYSARRRYGSMHGGGHLGWHDKQQVQNNMQVTHESEQEPAEEHIDIELMDTSHQERAQVDSSKAKVENLYADLVNIFQSVGVNIEIASIRDQTADVCTLLPCKCVYLKDKRDNYFLFICHKNQKVDFSNLKMQLKPKKKITPLDSGELQSLLHLEEGKENPFVLAYVEQPRFLVAIAGNLYDKDNLILTFPHPSDPELYLKSSVKALETFVKRFNHDRIAIPVKGSIETLQSLAMSENPSSTQPPTYLVKDSDPAHTNSEDPDPEADFQSSAVSTPFASPVRDRGNLFYQMTVSLRRWVLRCIGRLAWFLDRYLPSRVSLVLHRSALWQGILGCGPAISGDRSQQHSTGTASHNRMEKDKQQERVRKIAKLQHLIQVSGIPVEMEECPQDQPNQTDDGVQCKTYLVEDGFNRPYFILCSEDDIPTERNLRRLRTAFRSQSTLKFVSTEDAMQRFLSWEEGQAKLSWTPDDLHPLATLEIDMQAVRRPRVALTAELYCFPDTRLGFHLPALGVSLTMNCEDLESMLQRWGFCVVYLP